MVTKNALLYNRRLAIFTAVGISCGFLVHLTYSILGLAIIISQSPVLFNIVKTSGAIYLIYIGVTTMLHNTKGESLFPATFQAKSSQLTTAQAFKQGFLCNVLNPKVTLFFISLSSIIVNSKNYLSIQLLYGLEIFLITLAWFSLVAVLINLNKFKKALESVKVYFLKTVGFLFILLGIGLAFLKI